MIHSLLRRIFPTNAGILPCFLRIFIGIIFFKAGAGKLFGLFGGHGIQGTLGFFENLQIPFPLFNVYLVGCTEFFGGLAMILGFGVRLFAIPMSITMFVAYWTAHREWNVNTYYVWSLMLALLSFFGIGFGCLSIDRLIAGSSRK